jgi:hypothetical protein
MREARAADGGECEEYARRTAGAKKLRLAAFVARRQGAGVPGLVVGMDGTEPPTADAAVDSCLSVARLVHRRNGLTRPLEVPGFCLIHWLQHVPCPRGLRTLKSAQALFTRRVIPTKITAPINATMIEPVNPRPCHGSAKGERRQRRDDSRSFSTRSLGVGL